MGDRLAKRTTVEVTDEPSLHDWLTQRSARFLWRLAAPDKAIEGWAIGARSFVVVLYAKDKRGVGGGWDILTSCDSNDIDATLADADERLASHA